MPKSWGR